MKTESPHQIAARLCADRGTVNPVIESFTTVTICRTKEDASELVSALLNVDHCFEHEINVNGKIVWLEFRHRLMPGELPPFVYPASLLPNDFITWASNYWLYLHCDHVKSEIERIEEIKRLDEQSREFTRKYDRFKDGNDFRRSMGKLD